MKRVIALIALLAITAPALAAHQHPEKWYQQSWCDSQAGQTEVVLSDGTRCDCLTESHAIEFDFGRKWAESIGQALNYARCTGKRAGIVLILEGPEDYRYWQRLNSTITHHQLPIDTWIMRED